MSDHQPNHPEFSPLAAVVHSCVHPDSVSVGLNGNFSPCGQVALTRLTCIPGISENFLTAYLRATGTTTGIRPGTFGGCT